VSVFRRAAGVETAVFGDEQVVLDPHGRMLRGLNATGARVWELLDGHASVQAIAERVAKESGIDEARALADVQAFLLLLLEKKLVEPG
jgi:pyrroloquinoline quinone biosynthesis protein D